MDTSADPDHDMDSFNDETFGEGAVENDWETSHFALTGDTHRGNPPQLPLGHKIESDVEEVIPEVAQLKIKELWPSTPQSKAQDSIWSSPDLPPKREQERSPSNIPPGSKVMSVEELEREMTSSSPPSNSSGSPHPQSLSPSPAHHHLPPPGLSQHPPPGLPHPLHPRHIHGPPMMPPPMMPWPMHGGPPPQMHGGPPPQMHGAPPHQMHNAPPPPHGYQSFPPPRVPIMRHGILGHQPPFPLHGLPFPQHPQMPPQMMHPLFHHHHQPPNFGGFPVKSKRSAYLDEMRSDGSGFMTQKEKDWVIKIQLVQLQTTDPENEDYYYQNYLTRKRLPGSPAPHGPAQDPETPPDDPTPSPKSRPLPEFTPHTYKPKEFEGTLGKLTVSSIAAPRRTIDVPLNVEGSGKDVGTVGVDTVRKKRQALILIEKLYSSILVLEALEKSALTQVKVGEERQAAGREELTAKAFTLLRLKPTVETSTRSDDAVLLMIASFRKGKRAMKRLLPFLNHEQAAAVVLVFLRHLPSLIKKDSSDQVLPELTAPVTSVLTSIDLDMTNKYLWSVLEGPSLSTSSLVNSPSATVRVCASNFGAIVLLALLGRGQELAMGEGLGNHSEAREIRETSKEKWSALLQQLYDTITAQRGKLSSVASPPTNQLLQFLEDLV